MKNVTLSMNEDLLIQARKYAREHGMTLNSLIRKLLQQTVVIRSQNSLEDLLSEMDNIKVKNPLGSFTREELYDR